ncbi:cobyrinate a,c-diamide synthase [Vibrio viridaestus]|uniref:Cobyrinate a,c-diamide synthase n=1 Tax=Vibrio viridaestus TaxID=2487322 RepID=A0A3N9TK61_9VIBR|nr:cobyrinate a,c-diamide synthase [Vibrio viridaestus]RQW64561.1 cobyrinate a,c-diamide synthase [Vibrio viridaestus]
MKAILIGGTNSGSGKTTMTLGILKALSRRGLAVQPFKVGPDYIDTSWHTHVCGVKSRNLDAFMVPEEQLFNSFYHHAQQADICVIEGVMGLYDGYGTDPHYCSSAGMATALGCPVILTLDGRAVSTSAAATVLGFQKMDPNLNIAGILLNNVTTEGHFELIKTAIEKYCQIPVIGRLPKLPDIELPSRHLGLVTAVEQDKYNEKWELLADEVEKYIDIDKLLDVAKLKIHESSASHVPEIISDQGKGLTLALAYDEAFNFYYEDNLEFLEATGVEIKKFSPLKDSHLPDADMIYLGGGYPEIYAEQLAKNVSLLQAIKSAHESGKAIFAECGGLMYLGSTIEDESGLQHKMCDILPGKSFMTKALKRFGYCTAQANHDNVLMKVGQQIRGHEFHYSDFDSELEPALTFTKERDGVELSRWSGGYQVGNTFASYLHIHFGQNPQLILNWFATARGTKR